MKQFKITFLVSIIALMLFSSCKVAFIPTYNAELVTDIGTLQDDLNSVYTVMLASPDKSYASHEADYTKIKAESSAIVAKEQSRSHASNIIQQATIVQTFINRYSEEHKAKGSLTNGEIQTYKDYLQSIIKPLLVSELSLR